MRRRIALGIAAAGTAAAALVPATWSTARPQIPSLQLIAINHSGTLTRFGAGRGQAFDSLDLGVYLEAVDGSVEFDAHGHGHDLTVTQVRRGAGQVHVLRQLPNDATTSYQTGLGHFIALRWMNQKGDIVARQRLPWCPADSTYSGGRVNDTGPLLPSFPQFCGESSLTRAAVWGVDSGWAAPLFPNGVPDPQLADGSYTLRISIEQPWRAALHLAGATTITARVHITTSQGCGKNCCIDICPAARPADGAAVTPAGAAADARAMTAPTATPAAPGPAPDLSPLRPFHIRLQINRRTGRQVLSFAANVWNRGRGPLLVEGYRSGPAPYMQARQFFLSSGRVVASKPVGRLHFDSRRGHQHWHFEDFARYDLYQPSTKQDVRSEKQSFCIAPTDAIDLTLPSADWQPDSTGLSSACGFGDTGAIWMREVLPVGWGDTYYQTVAGQAFDVTHLPNGVYRLRITANPFHHLVETDYANDVAYQRLRLSGAGTARKLTLLPG